MPKRPLKPKKSPALFRPDAMVLPRGPHRGLEVTPKMLETLERTFDDLPWPQAGPRGKQ